MLKEIEIQSLIDKIVQRIHPEKVIVFGSYAKGLATNKSDLDIFIIKETDLPMINRGNDLKPILSNYLIRVDIHIYTPEEVTEYGSEDYSFVHSVMQTGKTFYEKTV
ncbi:nucleotidyltransferase domain-containing protein [Arcicella sp. LKC2W]|uniref:nucleotidyltransferase domain-containing protein n=1 Tax=Arcicella sp. LKC2W TaxID=2984198 RepID=UPI002B219609|nr:nucleotidyltransferase domain-containing protein [Arcicella sp. LKC2W]MEA5461681.1 nucleotidyltransferase domain-containing protein [Arcicella sp. LKC2W]